MTSKPTCSKVLQANVGNIKVVCRVRPPNKSELSQFESGRQRQCIDFAEDECTLRLHLSENDKQQFTYDRVFGEGASQLSIYEQAAKPVVQSVLEGYNGTVFAYGQTSSGKTHTMQGPSIKDQEQRGIIPRMVTTVFQHVKTSPHHIEFRIKVSIVEIYLEKIKDLLEPAKNNLAIREDRTRGVFIQDVTEKYVVEESEVFQFIDQGNQNRSVAFTNMNEESSRSHMLFIMTVHQNNLEDLSAKSGKLFLVDLAGSEKIQKTGAEGKTLEEAKRINQSLSCLGNVINSLTDGKSTHVPYRDSKLTRVLQESLGGNSTTTLIITCSPSSFNDQETLSTLRFGMRAKSIKNKPKINREYTAQELQLIIANQEKIIEEQKKQIKLLEKRQQASPNAQNDSVNTTLNNDINFNFTALEISNVEENEERVMELEAQLESERAKCEGYAFQLGEAKRELGRIEGEMEGVQRDSDIMNSRLTDLALCLNELEVEMLNNKLSLERSGQVKQKVLLHISQFKKLQKQVKVIQEGSLSKTQYERNDHTLEIIGKEAVKDINKDLLLVCQTKLSEEEFKLFLNQVIVMQSQEKESNEIVVLKEELVHEQQVRIQLEDEIKIFQNQLIQYPQFTQEGEESIKNDLDALILKQDNLTIDSDASSQNIENKEIIEQLQQQIKGFISQINENAEREAQREKEIDNERETWEKQLQKDKNIFKHSKEKIIEELQDKVNQVISLEQMLEKLRETHMKKEQEFQTKEDKLLFQINFFKERLDQKTQLRENILIKLLQESQNEFNSPQNFNHLNKSEQSSFNNFNFQQQQPKLQLQQQQQHHHRNLQIEVLNENNNMGHNNGIKDDNNSVYSFQQKQRFINEAQNILNKLERKEHRRTKSQQLNTYTFEEQNDVPTQCFQDVFYNQKDNNSQQLEEEEEEEEDQDISEIYSQQIPLIYSPNNRNQHQQQHNFINNNQNNLNWNRQKQNLSLSNRHHRSASTQSHYNFKLNLDALTSRDLQQLTQESQSERRNLNVKEIQENINRQQKSARVSQTQNNSLNSSFKRNSLANDEGYLLGQDSLFQQFNKHFQVIESSERGNVKQYIPNIFNQQFKQGVPYSTKQIYQQQDQQSQNILNQDHYQRKSLQFTTNMNQIGNDDTDSNNFIKSTQSSTYRSSLFNQNENLEEKNQQNGRQTHSISPLKYPQQQGLNQNNGDKPLQEKNYIFQYMIQYQKLISDFLIKKSTKKDGKNKRVYGSDILRGNPTISSYVNQFSLQLLANKNEQQSQK